MTRKIAMTTVRTVLNLLSHGLSYKKSVFRQEPPTALSTRWPLRPDLIFRRFSNSRMRKSMIGCILGPSVPASNPTGKALTHSFSRST